MEKSLVDSITGRPSERRVLGDTGWIEVTTTTGLKYYVSVSTKETTWLCPPSAAVWIAQSQDQTRLVNIDQVQDEPTDTQEEKRDDWVIMMIKTIKRLNVPPIMTYDRAIVRLQSDKDLMKAIPEDERQKIFERARTSILTKKPDSVLIQFQTKVDSLETGGHLRAEHAYEDVCQLFFHDPKWASVIRRKVARDYVEQKLKIQRDDAQNRIAALAPKFSEICKTGFGAFVASKLKIKCVDEEGREKLLAFLRDNEAVVAFASGSKLTEFRVWLRDNLKGSESVTVFGTFASHCDNEGLEELIADAWQSWFQETWDKMEKGEEIRLWDADTETETAAIGEDKEGGLIDDKARTKRAREVSNEHKEKRRLDGKRRAILQAETELQRKEQLASIIINEVNKDPYGCLPDEIFNWRSLSASDSVEIQRICFESLLNQLQKDPRWSQLELRLETSKSQWKLVRDTKETGQDDRHPHGHTPHTETPEETHRRDTSEERHRDTREERHRDTSLEVRRDDISRDGQGRGVRRDSERRVCRDSHRRDETWRDRRDDKNWQHSSSDRRGYEDGSRRDERRRGDGYRVGEELNRREERSERVDANMSREGRASVGGKRREDEDASRKPDGDELERLHFGQRQLKMCFSQHIAEWERQAHVSFKMLIDKSPDLPLETSYRTIFEDERFAKMMQKIPRWLVEEWLVEAERERRMDVLDSLATFLRQSTTISEVMRRLPGTADVPTIIGQVKEALKDEITWQKLHSAPSMRDDVVLKAVENASSDRLKGRLMTQKVLDDKRRYDELKESVKSELDQRDMDKRMLMNDKNSVAVEEEDLLLQGIVDEDI